jgi:hypothetical protein
LEVVGSGVSGEGQVLHALANDLVQDRRRESVGAEAADGEIITIAD